jgi:hypothetical protein
MLVEEVDSLLDGVRVPTEAYPREKVISMGYRQVNE